LAQWESNDENPAEKLTKNGTEGEKVGVIGIPTYHGENTWGISKEFPK
jgi:hypothetical protein